jgi:gamma-glutamylputrescine oxidase
VYSRPIPPSSAIPAPVTAWWLEAGDAPELPALDRDLEADLLIIGGGLTGTSLAAELSARRPDLGIVLVDAGRVASGASGRSGGQVLHWINGIEPTNPELARRLWDVTGRGIDRIAEVQARAEIGFARWGSLEVYTDARRAAAAQERTERLITWGVPVRWLDQAALRERLVLHGAVGATFDPEAGRVNGVLLARTLVAEARGRGVQVFEGTRVTRIREGAVHEVETAGGTIRARAIVLATNGYTADLGYFKRGLLALHSHVVCSPALSPAELSRVGWHDIAGFADDMDRIAYGCRSAGGRLIYGGGSNAAYAFLYGNRSTWPDGRAGGHPAVIRHLAGQFPALAGTTPELAWTGTLGVTMDRMCAMGVQGAHQNVYYALGYSGHGLALAMLAGEVLADIYCGDGARWSDLPFYNRRPGGIPPDPLRWLGYQMVTAATGKSPRRRA